MFREGLFESGECFLNFYDLVNTQFCYTRAITMHKTLRAVVLYGHENWTMLEEDMQTLEVSIRTAGA